MRRIISVLFAICIGLVVAGGGNWLYYVMAGDSPYDEVGSQIMILLPQPLRAWGCDKITERFGELAVPPMGCDTEGE